MKKPKLPFGMALVAVSQLPTLPLPLVGDPRTRLANGRLQFNPRPTEPPVMRCRITGAEVRRQRVGADSPKVDWVYWLYRDFGCGFSGMTADHAREVFVLVMDPS